MPPDHVLLMQKFEEDERLKAELDAKFGNDKAVMLSHLWSTHRHMFRNLDEHGWLAEAVEKWRATID